MIHSPVVINRLRRLELYLWGIASLLLILYVHLSPTHARGVRAAMVVYLLAFLIVFFRYEKAAMIGMAFLVPLSGSFGRYLEPHLEQVPAFLLLTFVLAFALKSLMLFEDQRADRGSLQAVGEHASRCWILICLISFVFVMMRFTNLYPFYEEPYFDYIVTRQGHRTSEVIFVSACYLASYFSAGVLFIYFLRYFKLTETRSYLTAIFSAYTVSALFAWYQQDRHLLFLLPPGMWQQVGRWNSTFEDPNALATSLILIFPLVVAGCLRLVAVPLVVCFPALLSMLYLLYLSASKTGFAGFGLGLVLTTVFLFLFWLRRRCFLRLGLLLAGSLVCFAVAWTSLHSRQDILLFRRIAPSVDYVREHIGKESFVREIQTVAFGREIWWPSAVHMIRDNPLHGVGVGVFQFETLQEDGAWLDSTGNQFLQNAAELGCVGLVISITTVLLLALLVSRLVFARRAELSHPAYPAMALIALGLACFGLLLMVGSHLLFIQVGFIAAMFGGMLAGAGAQSLSVASQPLRRSARWPAWAGTMLITGFFLSNLLALRHVEPADFRTTAIKQEQDVFGYPLEKWNGERDFRWLYPVAYRRIHVSTPELQSAVVCLHPDLEQRPVHFAVYCEDRLLGKMTVSRYGWQSLNLRFPPEMLGKTALLKIVTDRFWVPAETGTSPDSRRLAVGFSGDLIDLEIPAGLPSSNKRNANLR